MALGSARSIEELHPDVVALALRRLDGAALAAASCASARLRELASDPALWRDLCLATWPSLRHPGLLSAAAAASPRRLFSDASPFPVPKPSSPPLLLGPAPPPPRELISAVDLYRGGAPLLSRVVATDASSPWFLGSPFRIDALDRKSPPPPPAAAAACPAAELELSWILIDPARGRAVNLSSRRPVAVGRHWYTGETLIRYATVAGEFLIEATVTLGEETGHVREVSLRVGDADGAAVCGGDSLVILRGLMEGERRRRRSGGGEEEEEAKRRYDEFVKRKRNRKAAEARKELLLDFCCSAVGAAVFLAIVLTALLR
ncbi:probable F-box protein At1g60180 [Ananas comosus]|uniref:Probable F-box protein At1g60180 n=1 Tax=Ananas comosus TaxID=4615 RepID=A0A6P5GU39_ANACO|nr:probable F-box protein At1g60180 [Ananas comosus]XP_020111372.1 probable F-box protein At1g60180 [Ananas comosus]